MATQSLTFVGETATSIGDGYAGFRGGSTYELQVERRDNGTEAIVMDHHEHVSPGVGPLVVTPAQFDTWFKRASRRPTRSV
jgi:hypothetical protein